MALGYIVADIIIAVIGTTLNALVLVVIWRNEDLHTPALVLIGHLSLADFFKSIIVVTPRVIEHMLIDTGFTACLVMHTVSLMFVNMPIIMLMCVTAMRFVDIQFPAAYKKHINTKRAMYIAGCAWIFGICLGLIPLGWNNGSGLYSIKQVCLLFVVLSSTYMIYVCALGIFFIPMVIMLVIYSFIMIKLSKQTGKGVNRKKDKTLTKQFMVIILAYLVCLLPITVLDVIFYFYGTGSSYHVFHLAIIMNRLNSVINPIVYAFTNRRIKHALSAMLCKGKQQAETSKSNPTHGSNETRESDETKGAVRDDCPSCPSNGKAEPSKRPEKSLKKPPAKSLKKRPSKNSTHSDQQQLKPTGGSLASIAWSIASFFSNAESDSSDLSSIASDVSMSSNQSDKSGTSMTSSKLKPTGARGPSS